MNALLDLPAVCDPDCANGGECIDGKCACPDGFTGADCGERRRCAVKCENGGACAKDGKSCDCAEGFYGSRCHKR